MVRRNMRTVPGVGRGGRPPVAVVTRQGGGSDVRCNLLARVVPGIGLWCWLAASPPDWQSKLASAPSAHLLGS